MLAPIKTQRLHQTHHMRDWEAIHGCLAIVELLNYIESHSASLRQRGTFTFFLVIAFQQDGAESFCDVSVMQTRFMATHVFRGAHADRCSQNESMAENDNKVPIHLQVLGAPFLTLYKFC